MAEISNPLKFYGLDNLRAFAIIMVLLFHYSGWFQHPAWFPKVFEFGWIGVDLFFVLSGFLISSQLFVQIKKEGAFSMREFFIKRFFRIIPVYYFVVAIYFLFSFFSNDFGARQQLPPLWKFLTFTQNFNADFANTGSFSQVWSLCVEEQFYLILPFTLLFFLKVGKLKKAYLLLIILFLGGFLIRMFCYKYIYLSAINGIANKAIWLSTIYFPTYCRLDGLLIGVVIAAFYNYLPSLFLKLSNYANTIIVVGILIVIIAYFPSRYQYNFVNTIFGFPTICLAFGLLVLGAIMPNSMLYQWKSKLLSKIAQLSYSIYLIHMAVFLSMQTILFEFGIIKNSNLTFLFSLIFCGFFSLILHYCIEKPFMKIRVEFLKSKLFNPSS
ncbi:acyltransferase family protein [Pedobacter cryophilus]|uniref:Acyltransferase n=1 Tax=Pedobacter cryophilus TaxID=2571271 RepID=A0A4U1C4H6_9SPHI|nr:acyltransferase [Pedobacter cryophilus]TKC00283.1 acyltransferase [Pedobacter cryophilus]